MATGFLTVYPGVLDIIMSTSLGAIGRNAMPQDLRMSSIIVYQYK